ncbi:helix-turn-helix domain-containing protein [Butyrivibrio sp. MC2021]|uniref:helix-turn-helix domain-containing protein n=1 Tax=Butyrivibrio sp. MC2021 TaxID=1408306 RepID=UPI0006857FF6|nr:helix-turn-helix domain-containing protein [Butyrivibrio sp. MC2021]
MYKDQIQNVIDYIDQNLKTELSAVELADLAGYSVFHFYRVFQSVIGMPIMQYILRRRLLYSIYEIGSGRKKTDVALEHGFDTYAGFYKSFVREIGYTPAEYLRKFTAKKPYRINVLQEEQIMVSSKKIAEILSFWGLQDEKVADVVFGDTGKISETAKYVGEDHVIKYTNNLGNVLKAIDISKALENVGLASLMIVPTLEGKEYIENGELYFYLAKRVQGESILASNVYLDEYEKKARFIGEIVGQLDLSLEKIDVVVDEGDTLSVVRDQALPKLKDMFPINGLIGEELMKALERLYPQLPRQIIHRDPNPHNIIVAEDKWGFIDFDLSERNVRIFDPCYAATAILSETYEDGNEEKLIKWTKVMKEIMYGYDCVVHLSEEEKEAVPYIILANQLLATSWFEGKDKFAELFEVNRKMTSWILCNFEKMQLEET